MGSLRFRGVVFFVFTRDHFPPHVHATYGSLNVILELLTGGGIAVAKRVDAFTPRNPKKNEVRRVVRLANLNEDALRNLWRVTHESIPD